MISDAGDSAVLTRAIRGDAERRWVVVHALADAIEAAQPDGVYGIVPTYDTLLVEFDCARTEHRTIRRAIADAADRLDYSPGARPAPKQFVVPVVYGGEFGPDLPIVAGQLGLTEREVVELPSGVDLTVRCLGAPVGAPMMDGSAFGTP